MDETRGAASALDMVKIKAEVDYDAEQGFNESLASTNESDNDPSTDTKREVDSPYRKKKSKIKLEAQDTGQNVSEEAETNDALCLAVHKSKSALAFAKPKPKTGWDLQTGYHEKHNYVVQRVLIELHMAKRTKLRVKERHAEATKQLNLLYQTIDDEHKISLGIPAGPSAQEYKADGNRPQCDMDAKVLDAALKEIIANRKHANVKTKKKQKKKKANLSKPIAPNVKVEETESSTIPTPTENSSTRPEKLEKLLANSLGPVITPAIDPASAPSRVSVTPVRSNDLSFSRPFSTYATIPASPFAALHQVQSGRITKDVFKPSNAAIFSNSPTWRARAIDSNRSSSLSPTPSLTSASSLNSPSDSSTIAGKPKQMVFANRVDQALLKIEKWADSWLSGTFNDSNQDLAWESFEFCLEMIDVLDDIQENRAPLIKMEV